MYISQGKIPFSPTLLNNKERGTEYGLYGSL